ncbi:MAG: carboxylesterase family protein [Propionibacteriaceae bacterium]|nr:carboxylesterase family protein [Propionibacteriaceae bacterium]
MGDLRPVFVDAPAGRFRGQRHGEGGAVFAGIPFAAPPVGERRLRPPQSIPDACGEVDATRFPPAPAQVKATASAGQDAPGPVAAIAAAWSRTPTSEDCLYLNVWTPDGATLPGSQAPPGPARPLRPVIAWIYGGGFEGGSASPPVTDGAALARQTGAVVVAANYRTGALGFGHWAAVGGAAWADCSNLGHQDQLAALCWVRRNIERFGGDPENITVAGGSAGAFSVGALLAAPRARGLFHKAILHSGGAGRIAPAAAARRLAFDLLDAVGAASAEDLREVEVGRLVEASQAVVAEDIGKRYLDGAAWGTVLEGALLPRHPLEAIRDGAATGIPLLVGANRDEARGYRAAAGESFAPVDSVALAAEFAKAGARDPAALLRAYRERLGEAASLGDIREAFLAEAVYRRPASSLAAAHRRAGGLAWTYLFCGEPFGPALGACHGADAVFTFDHLRALGLDSPQNLAIRDEMMAAWASFVWSGAVPWPPHSPTAEPTTRRFGGGAPTGALVDEPVRDAVLQAWPLP